MSQNSQETSFTHEVGLSKAQIKRQQDVLRILATPMTIEALAHEVGASYMTVYRTLKPLVDAEIVVEVPWKEGAKKIYVAGVASGHGGTEITITTPAGANNIAWWAKTMSQQGATRAITSISGALAQLWRYRVFSRSEREQHLAGSMLPVECKAELRRCQESFKRLALACEQLLLAPIWEDDGDTDKFLKQFGDVDAPTMVELGTAFEERMKR